jgi:unsaturated rhamnogalacturonyl hydrolase
MLQPVIDATSPFSLRMALSVIRRYAPADMRWHYEHGLVLRSIYAAAPAGEQGEEIRRWVRAMYDTRIGDDGNIASYRADEFNLDQINPGKTLFDLYAATGGEKYRKAIEILRDQLRRHPRTRSGGFWHKQIYPAQMWLDGIYMASPFYARYVREFEGGSREDFADVIHQCTLIASKARNKATGLLYHAWDESRTQRWANRETGCSPHFWGRALGWYCMALTDIMDFLEDFEEGKAELLALAQRLTGPLLAVQDRESGLWYQVLDQGAREKNYLESSASSMFAYFLFKMLRKGYVSAPDADRVKAAALAAHDGLINRMLSQDESGELHLGGICSVAGLGGSPYRDGSYAYYVSEKVTADDFKGVGPFILASLEREKLGL